MSITSLIVIPEGILTDLSAELIRAREKFPSHKNLNAALAEEVGELVKAQLHQEGEQAVRKEALQVMCVALRIILEGDASLDLTPESTQV